MKLLSGIIVLLLALTISGIAAYFSVVGLAALFSAAFIPVVVMGTALEAGKLAGAQWLKSNWSNPAVGRWLKSYLLFAVFALMLITSLGIYGFLSKGHLEQAAPTATLELQIAQKEQQIQVLEDQNKRAYERMNQLDAGFNALINNKNSTRAAINERNKQKADRDALEKQITANNDKIQSINQEILPLKMQNNTIEAKLGPVKYVADLFNATDTEAAVRIVILILMFAFDPLAIVLMLCANITISEWLAQRRAAKAAKVAVQDPTPPAISPKNEEPISQPTAEESAFLNRVMDNPSIPSEVKQEVAPLVGGEKPARKPRTSRKKKATENLKQYIADAHPTLDHEKIMENKQMVAILENRPDLLDDIIEVVREADTTAKPAVTVPKEEILEGNDNNHQPEVIQTNVSQDKIDALAKSKAWLNRPSK